MPCTGIPIATVLATRLVPTRGRFVSALTLSIVGWIAGVVLTVAVAALTTRYFWDHALMLALPAIHAACGAVVAAGVRDRD